MKDSLTTRDFYNIMFRIRDYMRENRDYLTNLDSAIGDADHGINMERGFNTACDHLKNVDPENTDIGTVLMTVGNALLQVVGGAAGPLYGMFFMGMASRASGLRAADSRVLAEMVEAGLRNVQDIGGGTVPGEKTMVDSIYPALEALKEGGPMLEALERAVKAAERGMRSTIDMVAKKGRASYLGERSRGHQDPGATSSYLIFKAFYEYFKESGS